MKKKTAALATITGLQASSLFSLQARAHAHLKSADPAAESTVESAPGHLTLHFTEALEPEFSAAATARETP
ncbi:TPA: copper resistance protein CopC [Salmonella enterica]